MPAFKEYADYDALGLGELIAKKQVAPQEVLDAAIERIEAVNPGSMPSSRRPMTKHAPSSAPACRRVRSPACPI